MFILFEKYFYKKINDSKLVNLFNIFYYLAYLLFKSSFHSIRYRKN